jgi:hypothetical protein
MLFMQIRSNAYTCSVVLRNGLTLKVFYNDPEFGAALQRKREPADLIRSQSCWFYQNEYVHDAAVGLA